MDHRPLSLPLALFATVVLSACHDDSDSPPPAPVATNLGLAVVDMQGEGDHWLLSVAEAGQGQGDLNGDGDELDHVLHVLDLASGAVTSTSLDVTRPFALPWQVHVAGDLAAFAVSEAGQGATDLNGDGDADDMVLHVHERASQTIESVGISVAFISFVSDGVVGFSVSELDEGLDLDGDGVMLGSVLHYYDASTAEVVNTGINGDGLFHDGFIASPFNEAFLAADLNGDGDAGDANVVHLYDTRTRSLENLMVAVDSFGLFFGAGVLVLPVLEQGNGGADLNGDGDAEDVVIHTLDLASGVLTPTGLTGPAPSAYFRDGCSAGGFLLLATSESDGIDRNGDGDLDDVLPALLEPATGTVFEPGLAVDAFSANAPRLLGDMLVVAVSEERQGLDLDMDGDLHDEVLHVADPVRGTIRNLRIPSVASFQVLGGRIVVTRLESIEGADFDGDGELDDAVPFLVESTGTTINTRLGTTGWADGDQARMLFVGREELVGGGFRFEYVLYDVARRYTHRLGLLGGFALRAGVGASGGVVLTVNEQAEGADLNADGDLLDDVAHLVE